MGILNAHIGKLPEMPGRCVMEWSLLFDIPIGITSFFIDHGIDTGPNILFFEPQNISNSGSVDQAKVSLFSKDIEIYKKSLLYLLKDCPFHKNSLTEGKRYYVMSDLMQGVVNKILQNHYVIKSTFSGASKNKAC